MLVGELDEDVFEAGSEWTDFGDGNPVFQKLFAEIVKIKMILDESMDGLPENGGATNAGEMAREAKRARDFGSGDFHAQRAVRLHVGKLAKRIGRAVGDELAVINIGDVAAALGFVHLVRGHEKRGAVARKLDQKIPERAPPD